MEPSVIESRRRRKSPLPPLARRSRASSMGRVHLNITTNSESSFQTASRTIPRDICFRTCSTEVLSLNMPAQTPQHYYSRENFRRDYGRIFLATKYGIVARKNSDGCTPEPVATSLLSTPIHNLMFSVWDGGKGRLSYSTETQRQSDDSSKAPRLDGLFCASDPRHGECLRPVCSMEAKLQDFSWKGQTSLSSQSFLRLCQYVRYVSIGISYQQFV